MKSKMFVAAVAGCGVVLVAQAFRLLTRKRREARSRHCPSFAEPGISPDGATIAFVSGGDIWAVPARGGDARLLVSHPATESRPLFSPDGKRSRSRRPAPATATSTCSRSPPATSRA